jgi:hypothetical protein
MALMMSPRTLRSRSVSLDTRLERPASGCDLLGEAEALRLGDAANYQSSQPGIAVWLPAIGASANQNMDMRIVGAPMIDGDPIKFRSQVAFGTHHQLPCEFTEVLSGASSGEMMKRKSWRSFAHRAAKARPSAASVRTSNMRASVPSRVTLSRLR